MLPPHRRPAAGVAAAVDVLPGNAAGGARWPADVAAAVWQLASDAPAAGIPAPGSNADSNAAAERLARTPCGGKSVDADAAHGWSTRQKERYAGLVPREVVLPWGPPERLLFSLSGTFMDGWATLADRHHTSNQANRSTPSSPSAQKPIPNSEGNREGNRSELPLTGKESRRKRTKGSRRGRHTLIAGGGHFVIGPTPPPRAKNLRRKLPS